jgi:hypothetical protein
VRVRGLLGVELRFLQETAGFRSVKSIDHSKKSAPVMDRGTGEKLCPQMTLDQADHLDTLVLKNFMMKKSLVGLKISVWHIRLVLS